MSRKLLIVVSGAKFFLSHRLTLAKAAKAAGYEVHIATPASKLTKKIEQQGLIYHKIYLDRGGLNPIKDVITFVSLWRLYQKVKPDIVHHVTAKPILYGGLAARFAAVPAVVNAFTGLGFVFISQSVKIKLFRFLTQNLYRFIFRHNNMRTIFQNEDDRNEFVDSGVLRDDCCVLFRGSGVAMTTFVASEEAPGAPLIILPSRMLWDKGVGEFVAAAKQLQNDQVSARFILVGDCDAANPAVIKRQQLQKWVEQGLVEYWGERHDMPAIMQQAHIICLPSYREGLPRVLVEAAASARAIVTTDTPGCRDVVVDGSNGLLVPVKDCHALAAALKKLIMDAELRKQMGRRGRLRVERDYALSVIIDQTLALYDELATGLWHLSGNS